LVSVFTFVSRDELVPAVLARMAAEEIIAVPVVEEKGGKEQLVAFFDLSDFLALLFAAEKTDLATLPVRRAGNRSGHDVFMSVESGTGLYTLAEHFSRGVHRVPVMKGGRAEAIASQSALLEFLVKQLAQESGLEESCEQAGLTKHKATLVDASATLRQALRQLHDSASEAAGLVRVFRVFFCLFFFLSFLGQVGEEGRVVGSVDLAGLRGLDLSQLESSMENSASQFAASRKGKTLIRSSAFPVRSLLRDAAEQHAHHVLLTDDSGRSAGIVTLSDLVRLAIRAADRSPKKLH
jgi:CBS domain-containing protein